MNNNEMVFAAKDKDGYYFIGNNQWDKQLRKAKLYRSYKWAQDIQNDTRFIERDIVIVRVRIYEYCECDCEH